MSEILTPVGRLVQGDLFKSSNKDFEGNPLTSKDGTPRVEYFFAIAIPKTDAGYAALDAIIKGVAKAAFPNFFDAAGNCNLPTFSFKTTDGDSVVPNTKGNKPCDRAGFPGCWVLGFRSGFAPDVYTSTQPIQQILDPTQVKCGDYIRISGSVAGNNSTGNPGVFLNHNMVQFIGHGEAISSGPTAEQVFGGVAPALPPGASATPMASSPMPAPTAAVAAPAAPVTSAVPAPDFLEPPAAVRYVVKGKTYTEAELLGFNWTPAQIAAAPKA